MMAHQHTAPESAAIFSPSVARKAASDARDWSYIESWLSSKFPGRPVPSFERNPETLQALLALASANEMADEDRQLLTRAENDALIDINVSRGPDSTGVLAERVLGAIEEELPREGQQALESMASMAVQTGMAFPEPEEMGRWIIQKKKSTHEAERMKHRVDLLKSYLERDAEHVKASFQMLDHDDCRPPPELAKENLEMQRKIKAMSGQLSEMQERAAALASSVDSPRVTVDHVAREEQEYLAILSQKKQLDGQIAGFGGLPSNTELARFELDDLRSMLRGATSQRDAAFEGLVERESPVRRRH